MITGDPAWASEAALLYQGQDIVNCQRKASARGGVR